jgi:hypothetical protein
MGRKLEFRATSSFDLGGNPVRGNQEMLCFLDRKGVSYELGRSSRALGSSAHMPGFLSPRHPPSTRARSRHRDERQGQHSTRRTRMIPARHHLRACARTC